MTLTPVQAELLTGVLSFCFTVALLSYLIGDNPLYRLVLHIFIGVAVSYGILVVIYQVLRPRLITPLSSGDPLIIAAATVPLMLFLFLIMKLSPRTAALGNLSTAFLLGVGTAVAMGGALLGTLIPQVQATWLSVLPDSSGRFISNIILVVGTVTTLAYFQFWYRKNPASGQVKRTGITGVVAAVGQIFLVITLGAIYGNMILAGIAVFSERLAAVYGWVAAIIH
jgi:hypothetical protein